MFEATLVYTVKKFLAASAVTWAVFLTLLSIGMLLGIIAAIGEEAAPATQLTVERVGGDPASSDQILLLPISGIILTESSLQDPFTELLSLGNITYGYSVQEQLRQAADTPAIKAVVLVVNSPGGTVGGSQAIADGIAQYQEKTNQPVMTHITGLAASGSYWAAAGTDEIWADLGSTIGSIGIMNGVFQFYDRPVAETASLLTGGIVTEGGIETEFITAGRSKDLGNPYRRLTDSERRVLQQGADYNYQVFVDWVSQHRDIAPETVVTDIGALIYDNQTAQELGLIDGTANRDQVLAKTADQVQLTQYQVVRPKPSLSGWESWLSAKTWAARLRPQHHPELAEVIATSELCRPLALIAFYGDLTSTCFPHSR